MDFTAALVQVELGYLVPVASPIADGGGRGPARRSGRREPGQHLAGHAGAPVQERGAGARAVAQAGAADAAAAPDRRFRHQQGHPVRNGRRDGRAADSRRTLGPGDILPSRFPRAARRPCPTCSNSRRRCAAAARCRPPSPARACAARYPSIDHRFTSRRFDEDFTFCGTPADPGLGRCSRCHRGGAAVPGFRPAVPEQADQGGGGLFGRRRGGHRGAYPGSGHVRQHGPAVRGR